MLHRISLVLGLLLCSFGAFGAQDEKFADYQLKSGDRLIELAREHTTKAGNYPKFVDAKSGKTFAQLGYTDADYRKLHVGAVVRIPVKLLSERGRATLLPPQAQEQKTEVAAQASAPTVELVRGSAKTQKVITVPQSLPTGETTVVVYQGPREWTEKFPEPSCKVPDQTIRLIMASVKSVECFRCPPPVLARSRDLMASIRVYDGRTAKLFTTDLPGWVETPGRLSIARAGERQIRLE